MFIKFSRLVWSPDTIGILLGGHRTITTQDSDAAVLATLSKCRGDGVEKPIGSMYGITCLLVLCMVKCIGKLCK